MVHECPKDGCLRSFSSMKALEDHLVIGDCNYHQQCNRLSDKAKKMYSNKVNSLFVNQKKLCLPVNTTEGENKLEEGWALKMKKKKVQFDQDQIEYMKLKFDVGKAKGSKVDPFIASEEMRMVFWAGPSISQIATLVSLPP